MLGRWSLSAKRFIKDNSPARHMRLYRWPHLRPHRLAALIVLLLLSVLALKNDVVRIYYRPVRNGKTSFAHAHLPLPPLRPPPSPFRTVSGPRSKGNFDDRYRYNGELGKGCEGSAQLYVDGVTQETVVIKTWSDQGRNELPEALKDVFGGRLTKWPAEIEATLVLAGLEADGVKPQSYQEVGLLPALDYFAVTSTQAGEAIPPRWHLVTPFISGGTLDHFAKKLAETGAPRPAPQELDLLFRPSFDRALAVIGRIHAQGFCHDDVKPDNILVVEETNWIISDLGNVREIAHPYHSTADWTGKGQWTDCRANDLRRLLKSYLSFLRIASSSSSSSSSSPSSSSADARADGSLVFDHAFLQRQQSWSQLYWDFAQKPVSEAATLLDASVRQQRQNNQTFTTVAEEENGAREDFHAVSGSAYRRRMLEVAVTRELACVWVEKVWDSLLRAVAIY